MSIIVPSPPIDASTTKRGLVNTAAQSFAGAKTFTSALTVGGLIWSTTGGIKFPDNTTQTTAAVASGPFARATVTNTYSAGACAFGPGAINIAAINAGGNGGYGVDFSVNSSAAGSYSVVITPYNSGGTPLSVVITGKGTANFYFTLYNTAGVGTNSGFDFVVFGS